MKGISVGFLIQDKFVWKIKNKIWNSDCLYEIGGMV